jgi:hypothetical protein
VPHNFEAESGAKVRQKFQTAKFFSNFFLTFILRTFAHQVNLFVFLIAGAKVVLYF